MVQSVELTFSTALDAAVREEWALLVDADLPSQARHTGASNAPHITLGVAERIDGVAEQRLEAIELPREVRLGGLLVFQGRRSVLSRAVVPTLDLLAAQQQVAEAIAHAPGRPDNTLPTRWTPHVTLAHRLTSAELAAALDLLAERPRELTGHVRALRRWDSDARRAWDVVVRDDQHESRMDP